MVWTGAQPEDADHLDSDFLYRLHSVLDLTDKNGLYVVLDNHGKLKILLAVHLPSINKT